MSEWEPTKVQEKLFDGLRRGQRIVIARRGMPSPHKCFCQPEPSQIGRRAAIWLEEPPPPAMDGKIDKSGVGQEVS